jgi:hypothetical protein
MYSSLHKEDRAQYRVRYAAPAYVLFHLPLAVEVRDARPPVRAPDRAIDVVLDARSLRRVRELRALPDLALVASLPEVLHRKDPVHTLQYPLDGGAVLEVSACDLGPQAGELSRLRLLRISGQRTDPEPAPEETPRHRSSLLARGPANQDQTPLVAPVFHTSSFTLNSSTD